MDFLSPADGSSDCPYTCFRLFLSPVNDSVDSQHPDYFQTCVASRRAEYPHGTPSQINHRPAPRQEIIIIDSMAAGEEFSGG